VAGRRRFEALVAEALDSLPPAFAAAMSNVEIVVEDTSEEPGLLGLYQGIPLTSRDSGYAGVLPDRITIYRRAVEKLATGEEDLRRIVRETVEHELAHHFGIDDERLRDLGRD
jgi:predicted Zn-dependent protease with MMP-like domain